MLLLQSSFIIGIFSLSNVKRQAESETFPEVEDASLKNQGNEERATVDMWAQKETRCLGCGV